MICPSCKSENIEGADVCANCGQSLTGLDLPDTGNKHAAPPAFLNEPLSRIPARQIVTVAASDPVGLAARGMQTRNTGAVLVMDGDSLVGIITSSDLLHKVAGPREDLNAVTCSQIMTPEPIVFDSKDSITLAINKMAAGEFRHIPVVEDGKTINLIDVNDVFRFITPYLL